MNKPVQEIWTTYYLDPNEANFTRFYEATKGYVYTICYRVLGRDEDEAVDASQATFLDLIALAQNRPEAESIEDIDTLVRRLAVRQADKRRKRGSRRSIREVAVEFLEDLADSRPTAEQITSDRQIRELLDRVVDSLPDAYRIPLQLHYFNGMTHQEIADSLGTARSTVTKMIQAGLKRMEPLLRRAGLEGATLVFAAVLTSAQVLQPPSSMAAGLALADMGGGVGAGFLAGGGGAAPSAAEVMGSSFPLASATGSTLGAKGLLGAVAVAAAIGIAVWAPWRPSPPAPPAGSSPTATAPGSPAPGTAAAPAGLFGADSPNSDRAGAGTPSTRASGENTATDPGSGALSPTGLGAATAGLPPYPLSPSDSFTTGPRLLVSGRVSFPNGHPAPGAFVALIRSTPDSTGGAAVESIDALTSAGAEGRYFLSAADAGIPVRLEAWSGDLTRARADIPPPPVPTAQTKADPVAPKAAPDRSIAQDLVLANLGLVRGRVVDRADKPIARAEIRAVGMMATADPTSWTLRTESNAAGEFVIDLTSIRWGRARLAASAKGYAPDGRTVSIPEDNVVLRLAPGGAGVEGRVFRKSNGRPVAGAVVRAYAATEASWTDIRIPPFETRSTAGGEFRFQDLPEGRLALEAEKDDLVTAGRDGSGASRLTLKNGESHRGVSLLLHDRHFIAGTVKDAFGNPVENARIAVRSRADEIQGRARSDKDGRFRIEELPDLPMELDLRHDDYEAASASDVEVDRTDVDIVLQARGRVTLVGSVVDWKTKSPVKGLAVDGEPEIRPVVDSTQPGRFTAADLVPGQTYRLRLRAEGYSTQVSEPIRIPAGSRIWRKTFDLGASGTILGRVRSIYTKEPLAGVRVALETPRVSDPARETASPSATTDAEGRFSLPGPGRGQFKVTVQAEAPWVPRTLNAVVDFEDDTDLGEIEINRYGTIRGRVVSMPGESPRAGEAVSLHSNFTSDAPRVVTGPDGRFEFKGLPYILYSVILWDHQYLDLPISLDQADTLEMTVPFGTGIIRGRVFREGRPAAGIAGVRIDNIDPPAFTRYVSTDAQGYYELKDIPAGRWRLESTARIKAFKPQTASATVEIAPGQIVEKDFTLPSGVLTGRVLGADGRAVSDASVAIRSPMDGNSSTPTPAGLREIRSRDDGTFEVEGLPPGTYAVVASWEGMQAAPIQPVEVPFEGETEPALLQLQRDPTGTVVSTAIDYMSRRGIPTAWCHLSPVDGAGKPGRADHRFIHVAQRGDDGVMTVRHVPVGTYDVEVSAYGYSLAKRRVSIEAGKTVSIDDVLYEAGALRWTFTDRAGKPLAGVECRVVPQDPTSIETPRQGTTNAAGLFVARGLFPGYYVVTATLGEETQESVIVINAHDVTEQTTLFPPPTTTPDSRSASLRPQSGIRQPYR